MPVFWWYGVEVKIPWKINNHPNGSLSIFYGRMCHVEKRKFWKIKILKQTLDRFWKSVIGAWKMLNKNEKFWNSKWRISKEQKLEIRAGKRK